MHPRDDGSAKRDLRNIEGKRARQIGPLKAVLIRGVDMLGRAHVDVDTNPGATNLMFHEFFGPRETKSRGRERLKRLCDWVQSKYQPISAGEYIASTVEGSFKKNALFFTFDDARARLLDGIDILLEYEIPVTVFAACGWTGRPRVSERGEVLARLMAIIEHYRGETKSVRLPGGERLSFGTAESDAQIDRLLVAIEREPDLEGQLWDDLDASIKTAVIGPTTCDWSELHDLAKLGVSIQSHSMSHCRLRAKAANRVQFEVTESRRILERTFGSCQMFAYPYGTWDVYSDATTSAVKTAGYRCAFLAAAGFGLNGDPFLLPRIDIPDAVSEKLCMSLIRGGQVPLILLKNRLTGRGRLQEHAASTLARTLLEAARPRK